MAVVGAVAGSGDGVGMGAAALARAGAALAWRSCRPRAAETMTRRGLRRCDGTTKGSADLPGNLLGLITEKGAARGLPGAALTH